PSSLRRSRSPHAPASTRWPPEPSRFESFVLGHMEANMKIRTVCGALILGGLVAGAATSTLSLAQSKDKGVSAPKDAGAAAPKSATESATKRATLNTNTNPT